MAMIAATLYFTFLIIIEFQNKGNLSENLVDVASDTNKDFMTTHFSKYLFPIFYAIFFFHICLNILGTDFKFYDNMYFFQFIAVIHMNILLPIFLIFEMFLVTHARAPKYLIDCICLSAIILFRWGIANLFKYLFKDAHTFGMCVVDLGQNLILCLVAINGYFLYDYRVFKAANPEGTYAIQIE